jgi:hypothetical protein
MSIKNASMWLRLLVFVGVGLAGCGTRPNPRSCADGLCTDQAFPFCDVDGVLGGTPNECIAVTCTPEEFAGCRGTDAIVCNNVGNDFNLVDCPLGCDEAIGGCVRCATDGDCGIDAPVCDDETGACRTCALDSECPSEVCNADGSCAQESEVAYASPTGGGSTCAHATPCSVILAVTAAKNAPVPLTVRLLPGVYAADIVLPATLITPQPIVVVATGANLAGLDSLNANLDIRNATVAGSLACLGPVAPPFSGLILRDSVIDSVFGLSASNCHLRILNTTTNVNLNLGSKVTVEIDRMHMRANEPLVIAFAGPSVSARITNSVLEDVSLSFRAEDNFNDDVGIDLAFNTIVLSSPNNQHVCPTAAAVNRTVNFENNVMVALAPPAGSQNVIVGTTCTTAHNVMFPQVTARPGNIIADPLFVDGAAKNFRLQATSPAIDAAMPSAGLESDHDFEGTTRPQGPQPDIGAFEAH